MSVELVAHHSSSPSRPGRDASASSPLLAISNVMVGLYKEAFGRGPTKVRTTVAGPDTVVVVLEDGFTVAERTLLGLGEVEVLRNSRLAVQEALEERARSPGSILGEASQSSCSLCSQPRSRACISAVHRFAQG